MPGRASAGLRFRGCEISNYGVYGIELLKTHANVISHTNVEYDTAGTSLAAVHAGTGNNNILAQFIGGTYNVSNSAIPVFYLDDDPIGVTSITGNGGSVGTAIFDLDVASGTVLTVSGNCDFQNADVVYYQRQAGCVVYDHANYSHTCTAFFDSAVGGTASIITAPFNNRIGIRDGGSNTRNIILNNGSPDGSLAGGAGSLCMNYAAGTGEAAAYVKPAAAGTDWHPLGYITATTAQLEDITNEINTVDKTPGRPVINSDTNVIVHTNTEMSLIGIDADTATDFSHNLMRSERR